MMQYNRKNKICVHRCDLYSITTLLGCPSTDTRHGRESQQELSPGRLRRLCRCSDQQLKISDCFSLSWQRLNLELLEAESLRRFKLSNQNPKLVSNTQAWRIPRPRPCKDGSDLEVKLLLRWANLAARIPHESNTKSGLK